MPNASHPSSIKIKQKKIKKLALEPHFCYNMRHAIRHAIQHGMQQL